jgi:putative photosynthetic complex assembly protein
MSATLPVKTDTLPWAVKLLGGMLLLILMGVGFARLQGYSAQEADAATVWHRDLSFTDGPEGAVLVIDASSKKEIAKFEGEQGFLRSTLRALVRERRREGMGPETPLNLIGRADGRLTLLDPSTRQRIDLEAFGPTNAAVFGNLRFAGLAKEANQPSFPKH